MTKRELAMRYLEYAKQLLSVEGSNGGSVHAYSCPECDGVINCMARNCTSPQDHYHCLNCRTGLLLGEPFKE